MTEERKDEGRDRREKIHERIQVNKKRWLSTKERNHRKRK